MAMVNRCALPNLNQRAYKWCQNLSIHQTFFANYFKFGNSPIRQTLTLQSISAIQYNMFDQF